MPTFLCPCCGESYLVSLAYCEFILEERIRGGWKGTIAPARCIACQQPIAKGDSVILRSGTGVLENGDKHPLQSGSNAVVVDVSTWEGEGSIFLVRLPTGVKAYVARTQLSPQIE
jgi:hypothetical protein